MGALTDWVSPFGVHFGTIPRLQKLADACGCPQAVYPLLLFLRSSDSIASLHKHSDVPKGWRDADEFKKKLSKAMASLAPVLKASIINPMKKIKLSEAEKEITIELFGKEVALLIDSVPLYCSPGVPFALYNTHYKSTITKALFLVNLRGFIADVAGPFGGRTWDTDLLVESDWYDVLTRLKRYVLGDHHFSHDYILNQFTKSELAGLRRAYDIHDTEEDWTKFLTALQQNDEHGFIRSRVEHTFGPNAFGRWKRFKEWKIRDAQFFYNALICAAGLLNLDNLVVHGSRGRYAAMDDTFLTELKEKTRCAPFALSRYPELLEEEQPSRKKKRKRTTSHPPPPPPRACTPCIPREDTQNLLDLSLPTEASTPASTQESVNSRGYTASQERLCETLRKGMGVTRKRKKRQ